MAVFQNRWENPKKNGKKPDTRLYNNPISQISLNQ